MAYQALCCASAPLGLLAFGLAGHVRRAASAVVLAIVLSNSYFALMWVCAAIASGRNWPVPVPAWTPNVVFALVGSALLVRASRPTAAGNT